MSASSKKKNRGVGPSARARVTNGGSTSDGSHPVKLIFGATDYRWAMDGRTRQPLLSREEFRSEIHTQVGELLAEHGAIRLVPYSQMRYVDFDGDLGGDFLAPEAMAAFHAQVASDEGYLVDDTADLGAILALVDVESAIVRLMLEHRPSGSSCVNAMRSGENLSREIQALAEAIVDDLGVLSIVGTSDLVGLGYNFHLTRLDQVEIGSPVEERLAATLLFACGLGGGKAVLLTDDAMCGWTFEDGDYFEMDEDDLAKALENEFANACAPIGG